LQKPYILFILDFQNKPSEIYKLVSGKYYFTVVDHYIFMDATNGIDRYKYKISYLLFSNNKDVYNPL